LRWLGPGGREDRGHDRQRDDDDRQRDEAHPKALTHEYSTLRLSFATPESIAERLQNGECICCE
jgi:hypothetical protein